MPIDGIQNIPYKYDQNNTATNHKSKNQNNDIDINKVKNPPS